MAAGGGSKRRYQYCSDNSGTILYLRALQGHSGNNLIDPVLQDNVVIGTGIFPYMYHVGCTFNLHSVINNGLVLGGQNFSRRQTVFFLLVDPRDESHRDPERIDFSVPRLARYVHSAWKRHQDTVFWVDIDLGIREGLMFYQTRSNAIILQGTLPAHCIVKVERLKNGEKLFERQYLSPRPPPKISLKHDLNWSKGNDQGSTVEHQPVEKRVQQSLGETLQPGSSKLTQSPKTNRDSTGKPVAQEVVVGVLQEEPSSSDSTGRDEPLYKRQYLSPRPPPKISLKPYLNWTRGNDELGSTVEQQPVGKLVQQSLGETLQFGSSKPTQFPKPTEDRTGQPVTQEIVRNLQGELSSSDRSGQPVTEEEQHVRNHDNSGKPDGEEKQHTVQENYHLKSRDNVDKFDLATDDANVDFSVSGIPEEVVKRSETSNILQLIRRITRHPQKQAR